MPEAVDFTFRQFGIRQDQCAMKVGTDGVLLGAWANGGHRILDIGTGTGLIALMMAQRCKYAHIEAVEIDPAAAIQARQNVEASPFAERINIVRSAIQDYRPEAPFDSIVSNPPFFASSLKNPDNQRATARHADTLTYADLFGVVKKWLTAEGEFSAVIPTDCLSKFVSEAYLAGLTITRRLAIRTTPRKQPKRHLVAFAKLAKPFINEEQCLQNADGTRSLWYEELTSDFYIK